MSIIKGFSAVFCIGILCLTSCFSEEKKDVVTRVPGSFSSGIWRLEMPLNDSVVLPFHIELTRDSLFLLNAEERLGSQYELKSDSIFCKLAVFDSWFELELTSDTTLEGRWVNNQKASDYFLPVSGFYSGDRNFRFVESSEGFVFSDFSGKYEVQFLNGENLCTEKAIGEFVHVGNSISGTFLTETGDYRYLEGNVYGSKMMLSTFDGSHAFLFDTKKEGDTIYGSFYSGKHYHVRWKAFKNADFQLEDPYNLTYLNPGYNHISFVLPKVTGADSLVFPSAEFENKVVILQIFGSWCPNCLDETRFYKSLHDQYATRGLEIIGIGFELPDDLEDKKERIRKLIEFTGVNYHFVVGGKSSKSTAGEVLPQLNHIMSFPTSVFIDKKGKVRKIHTGFSGPGTGKYYTTYTEKTIDFVEMLLKE